MFVTVFLAASGNSPKPQKRKFPLMSAIHQAVYCEKKMRPGKETKALFNVPKRLFLGEMKFRCFCHVNALINCLDLAPKPSL